MNKNLSSNSLTLIDQLKLNLLSTLDEGKFYSVLSDYLNENGVKSSIDCYIKNDEQSLNQILKNNKIEKSDQKIIGVLKMVSKNRSSYFTNSVSSDPLFASIDNKKFSKQLCVPLVIEGVVVSILIFKRKENEESFERTDVTTILSITNELSQPLSNLLMYLEAKRLNRELQNTINSNNTVEKVSSNQDELNENDKIFKLVLRSKSMQRTKMLADKLSQTNLSFTIEGELGTGKEFMAKYVTDKSSRKESPFVTFDASTVDPILADVLLFGAKREGMPLKEGLIARANGGTLLIKNVFLLPENVQRKLLNVIKEKVFARSGEEQFRKVDIRVVVSTREPLSKFYEEGRLRQDFFFEVARVTLNIPSLLDRADDMDQLASHFLNKGRSVDDHKSFSPAVLNSFKSYNWPGNVRELANLSERAYMLSEGMIIERSGIESKIVDKNDSNNESNKASQLDENFVQISLEEVEKMHICKMLEHLAGNKTKTAKALGITVKTLYNKLHAYNLIEAKQ